MRITGGEAKGRIIKVPKEIRPTQDKIRAIIFDVLRGRVNNARFVDLFAGSGSVGIEALSRGAREAIFVERSQKVIKTLKDNLKSLGYLNRSKVIAQDALKLLSFARSQRLVCGDARLKTIIFADPPYDKGFVKKIVEATLVHKDLETVAQNNRAGAPINRDFASSTRPAPTFIIEHSKHEPIELGKHYKSGDTIITFI